MNDTNVDGRKLCTKLKPSDQILALIPIDSPSIWIHSPNQYISTDADESVCLECYI